MEKNNQIKESYIALNAMLNLYDENGKIQFDKDRLAAKQYFFQHVNQNTVFFHTLKEKLKYMVTEDYYEEAVLDQYSFDFIKSLFKKSYDYEFRFETFVGALKYYTGYTLKTFDGMKVDALLDRRHERLMSYGKFKEITAKS